MRWSRMLIVRVTASQPGRQSPDLGVRSGAQTQRRGKETGLRKGLKWKRFEGVGHQCPCPLHGLFLH